MVSIRFYEVCLMLVFYKVCARSRGHVPLVFVLAPLCQGCPGEGPDCQRPKEIGGVGAIPAGSGGGPRNGIIIDLRG